MTAGAGSLPAMSAETAPPRPGLEAEGSTPSPGAARDPTPRKGPDFTRWPLSEGAYSSPVIGSRVPYVMLAEGIRTMVTR
jgi:hypothetical protein